MDEVDLKKRVGKRFKLLRVMSGKQQHFISKKLGYSQSMLASVEGGQNFPSMGSFFCLLEYYGVTPQEFFDLRTDL